ncbi:C-type lectin domain family 12 member B-like [Columba livia]|uniref:C-type lectin domain family 12 member B-like n=1 Tax=Columba livia TaxID=8932 RepID=A0A2I0LXW2_COLLI|nr:C-type lectin domain family 12 member B-like [Columba livia]
MTKNELHANFSSMLLAIGNQLCLEGETNLKNNGQNCVLCPTNWNWEGGNTCYYYGKEAKSWEQSRQFCSAQNSTLLLIKEAEKLELAKKKNPESQFLFGLTFRDKQRDWYWEDNTALTKEQKSWTRLDSVFQYCGYFYYHTIYSQRCKQELYYICEKPAIRLQRHDNHWQEDWFIRSK